MICTVGLLRVGVLWNFCTEGTLLSVVFFLIVK